MNTRLVSMAFAAFLLLCGAAFFAGEYEDGVAAYNRGDYKTALALFTKAANKGDAKAQNNLGAMYDKGQGVPQDYNQAASWYRRAADQGDAEAQYNLGLMYEAQYNLGLMYEAQYNLGLMYNDGRGVPQDYKQAVSWFRKAADQGDAKAQYNLGLMYYYGHAAPKDYVEALKWITIAAAYSTEKENRDHIARNRDIVANKMTPAQIAEAQKRASEWKKK